MSPASLPSIFDLCQPRADVLAGRVSDADFAADLASVIGGTASPEYLEPARFFANTYPTRGLRDLLANVCRRLSGTGGEVAAIFRLDTTYGGMPPYTAYVARTAFLHTLAFNDPLKGLSPEELRHAVLAPTLDISFIKEARAELNDRIGYIFNGNMFDAVRFPGGPFDVPDEVGDGCPKLVVLSYDAVSIDSQVSKLPALIDRIYTRKGSEGQQLRALRNHLVFVATDDNGKVEMQRRTRHRLALAALKRADRLRDLAEHQQAQVLELEARSEQELAIAIQQVYRHMLYPSSDRADPNVTLAHTAIDIHSAADQLGVGQRHIERALRELQKLRLPEDALDTPVYVRDRTPLRKGQMTTLALRDEFRRDPARPMLIGEDTFIRGIRTGVERGDYVYQRGDLLFGPGDPFASITIDEQAMVLTMAHAKSTHEATGHALSEDFALTLGLLFRALAPMRNRGNMRMVAESIVAMQREEAAYWLGMAMHRKRPRRVLAALRMLLTEPRASGGHLNASANSASVTSLVSKV